MRGLGWGVALVCLVAGYFLGQSVGPAPVEFPDPGAARSAAELRIAVEAALEEPRAFVRASTLTRLFEGLTRENVSGAAEAISARAGRWDPVDLQIFLTAWVHLDPEAAVREVESWPIKSRRHIGLNVAIREWAASGRGIDAANYVQTITDPLAREKVAGPLVRGWALSGDYQGALELAHRLWHQENREDVVDGFARGVLQVEGASPALGVARQVAAQGEGPFERRMVRVILNLAGREDPPAAAAAYADITAAGTRDWLAVDLDQLMGYWRNDEPRAALEWALELRPSPQREQALIETIAVWGIRDFDVAWAWFVDRFGPVERLEAASELDEATSALLAGLVRKMARTQPVEASTWVVRLRPGAARDTMLKRVAHFWAMDDASAVAAWIDGLGLDEAAARPLREAAERGARRASLGAGAEPTQVELD